MNDDRHVGQRGGPFQQRVEIAVICAVETEISAFLALEVHEIFEGIYAEFGGVAFQLSKMPFIGDAEVESEIDMRSLGGVGILRIENIVVGRARQEIGEDRGESALRGVYRFGGIFGDRLAETEMNMSVDQAGKDVQAGRIDRFARGDIAARCEAGDDLAVTYGDVARRYPVHRIDDRAVPHDQVKARHWISSGSGGWVPSGI